MDAPPVLAAESAPRPPLPGWRNGAMLLLLAAYPVVLGIAGARQQGGAEGAAALPSTVRGLLLVSTENLLFFGLLFGAVWALGRPTRRELWADGRCGVKCWALGLGYSAALRVALGAGAGAALATAAAALHLLGKDPAALTGARPQIENLLDPAALRDPVYLLLAVTLVSFGVAGLREELWRAALLAALLRFAPAWRGTVRGRLQAAGLAALVFGLGHLPQGWGGVVLTGALGLGLGVILMFQRSLWVAVLAHGFFDATSLLLVRAADHFGLLDRLLGR